MKTKTMEMKTKGAGAREKRAPALHFVYWNVLKLNSSIQKKYTMYQKCDDKIRMMADFDSGQIRPVIFSWNNKKYKVKDLSLAYQERDGASMNYYFSVECEGGGVFKLRYNDQKLIWVLEEYWVE